MIGVEGVGQPTVAVELTPRGRAAVAVVLVAGPGAVAAVDECFHPVRGKRFADAPIDRILLGRWGGADGEELIACHRANGSVEVHCHGGVAAVDAVVERLRERGCQSIDWRDYVRQTATDPIRAAAAIALAEAPTARTAGVLLDQWNGALATAVREVLAAAEAGDWAGATAMIDEVRAHRQVGSHLTTPWQVVLVGRPNVGKSSLLNALAGYQRAIVCDVPGTTRDVVTIATAIDGWPVQISDTAGLRATAEAIEAAGVARTEAAMAGADLILYVDDVGQSATAALPELLRDGRVVRVLNKIDLLATLPAGASGMDWDLFVSARTGQGIDVLVAAMGRALVPAAPEPGAGVPFSREQCDSLEAARQALGMQDAAAVEAALGSMVGA